MKKKLKSDSPLRAAACSPDPFDISGVFYTAGWDIVVRLQTNNPTTQHRDGQLFVERQMLGNGKPFNKNIACMLRRLADSVEFNWENSQDQERP